MTITELFITANRELLRVVEQIKPEQWTLDMPAGTIMTAANLETAIRYSTYDDAWVPDTLAGKTIEEIGATYDDLKSGNDDVLQNYREHNRRASEAVEHFTDFDRQVHLSYGDYPARDYMQHIVSFRAFRSYDIAKLIGIDTTMDPTFVAGLLEEFEPVMDWYHQLGIFPPALPVADDADPQTRLLALIGRR